MEMIVSLNEKQYPIRIERGLIYKVGEYIESDRKAMIISDDGVPKTYIRAVAKQLKNREIFIFPHGEKSKSVETYRQIVQALLKSDFSKRDYIVALGGGVTGDLCGFVAATFKRGLRYINIPTTTLSMVDSSIGGKVALNESGIKNAIGTFYHPDAVLIDPDTLETLPKRHFVNGAVEALKTGLIGDRALYELISKEDYRAHFEEIIARSLKVKAEVVMKDEKEKDLRKILNFGHTFGHAYEAYFAMKNYLHGEAVALGMLTVSRGEPYYEELKALLKKWRIKTEVFVENDKIIELIGNDKKADHGKVDLILVKEIGRAEIVPTAIDDLKRYLEEEK